MLFWLWLENAVTQALLIPAQGFELTVARGAGVNLLADQLVEQNVLKSSLTLKIYARLFSEGDIQAGDYQLPHGTTLPALLTMLTSGAIRHYSITFPEGWTLSQWCLTLASTDNIGHTLSESCTMEIVESLGIDYENPEGWFAPNTYAYRSGDSDLSILRRAYQQMSVELSKLWVERQQGLPYATPYEALVMASIVEKETGVAEERAQIAGVFVRRLQKDMRLQTDPTIIYGLGEQYEGNLTRQHLQLDTAYNTYLHNGLPPTPIANPGVAALEAALHPASGNELFFVARGDGSHYFSTTLDEHNKAVRKYQITNRPKAYRSLPQQKESAIESPKMRVLNER